MESEQHLLSVQELCKYFPVKPTLAEVFRGASKLIKAVDNISFDIVRGTTFGLVGETGCGKTTTSKVILRLQTPTAGRVVFQGIDVHGTLSKSQLRVFHRDIQAVFQDPASSLDPRMTIGQAVREPLEIQRIGDRVSREETARKVLEAVGLTSEQYDRYPHELSGGQQQRVAIARALILNPKLVVLDEPVSALDMSVRSQILNLLKDLQSKFDLTYLFVAHDLSVVRYMSDAVAVMYLGKIVESCETRELFGHPLHPYTKALLDAVPVPDPSGRKTYEPLRGSMPRPINIPRGCRFHTRCPHAMEICSTVEPELLENSPGHRVSCHLYTTV